MTERQEIRVKALGMVIDLFNVFKNPKIFTVLPEETDKDKLVKVDDTIGVIFKICEQFEEFILKALPDRRND